MDRIYKNVYGQPYKIKRQKPGPKPQGLKAVLVDLPVDDIARLKSLSAEFGGYVSVNQLIRDAVRAHLDGLVYINPVIT